MAWTSGGKLRRRLGAVWLGAMALGSLPLAAPVAAAPNPPPFTPTVQFRLPWVGGQQWRMSQGWHYGPYNESWYAYDFVPPNGNATPHLPVVAVAAGTVVEVITSSETGSCDTGDPSNNSEVTIDHHDGTFSRYLHMDAILVADNEQVDQGEIIGRVGCRGNASGVHLHFTRMYDSNTGSGQTLVSMKTSFQDVPSSGTLGSPAEMLVCADGECTVDKDYVWYKSLNPCSMETGDPMGAPTAIPQSEFCARYYVDKNLYDGGSNSKWESAMSLLEVGIAHNWGTSGFPGTVAPLSDYKTYFTASDPTDNFSAKYAGRFYFPSLVTWTFKYKTSDGIRIYIDNMTTPVVDMWTTDRTTPLSGQYVRVMSTGWHVIRVDYFQSGTHAAILEFGWYNCQLEPC